MNATPCSFWGTNLRVWIGLGAPLWRLGLFWLEMFSSEGGGHGKDEEE